MRKRIGEYNIQTPNRPLGHGLSAAVYLATHTNTPRKVVALKFFHLFAPDERVQKTFIRETKIITRLDHPNIIRVLHVGFDDDNLYYVMSYAPGGNLRSKVANGPRLLPKEADVYLQQIAAAIQHVHDSGLVHCDLKPENILISGDGTLLLADFGITRSIQTIQAQSTQGAAGTPLYMAPEQFMGKPDMASDQYGLGVIAYELLAGRTPFIGNNAIELMNPHLHDNPPPLATKNSNVSPRMEDVIFRALAKKPKDRFPTVLDFARAFHQAIQEPDNIVYYKNGLSGTRQIYRQTDIRPLSVDWKPVPVQLQLEGIPKLKESDYYDCFLYSFPEDSIFVQVLRSDLHYYGSQFKAIDKNLIAANDIGAIKNLIRKGAKLLLILSEDSLTKHYDNGQLTTILNRLASTLGSDLVVMCIDIFSLEAAKISISNNADIHLFTSSKAWKNSNNYKETLRRLLSILRRDLVSIPYPETKSIRVSPAPIEYRDCLIISSKEDSVVNSKIYTELENYNIRVLHSYTLRDSDNITTVKLVDHIMHMNSKVLLLLSEHSTNSSWIEEVTKAIYNREKEIGQRMFIPILVDDITTPVDNPWSVLTRQLWPVVNTVLLNNPLFYKEALETILKELKINY
jgi:serine/threonine protein kinase